MSLNKVNLELYAKRLREEVAFIIGNTNFDEKFLASIKKET